MIITDLSHLINNDTVYYPGTEKPTIQSMDVCGTHETKLNIFTHTGTHIDAPYHIYPKAKKLNDFPLDKFTGKGLVINCYGKTGRSISTEFLIVFESRIREAEFILFNSGWSLKWNDEDYFGSYPTLTKEAAQWLTRFPLKGIGMDYISIDPVDDSDLPIHHIVLEKEILIIENLANLDLLQDKEFTFECFPLNIENADGSPVRAIGIEKYSAEI